MKVFTQAEFDALPVVGGYKQCPTGDYTAINSFGDRCRFGAGCSFGAWCSFGAGCRFGEGCSFEGGHKAKSDYPLMAIAGAGSDNRTTYFFNTEDGIIVRSGCFKGTLAEFREKVRRDCPLGTEVKAVQYLGFANIVAATWSPEEIEK